MAKVLAIVAGVMTEVNISAGGANVGTGVIDFGSGRTDAKLVVTGQAGILSTSSVTADVLCQATAAHSDDEHWVDGPLVSAGSIVPGTGFTVYARTNSTPLYGKYSITWSWS
jgi:hypothetical protein